LARTHRIAFAERDNMDSLARFFVHIRENAGHVSFCHQIPEVITSIGSFGNVAIRERLRVYGVLKHI
jgi:hypothetical protein